MTYHHLGNPPINPLINTYVNAQKLLEYMSGASCLCHSEIELLNELEYYLWNLPEDAKLKKENTNNEK